MMAVPVFPVSADPAASSALGVDVESASLGEVEEVICRWAGRIAAATCAWLLAVAAFDRRQGWSGMGLGSCAHWLSWRCGIGLRTAREQVATGHALERLPAIRAAFAAGTLSYAKVRAVTRIADEHSEQAWLTHARFCTAGQIERLVRCARQARGQEKTRRSAPRLGWQYDDDGMLRVSAVLSPDDGARLIAALDAARAGLDTTTPLDSPGDAEAGEVPADGESVVRARDRRRDAEALVALADGFLDRQAPGLTAPEHTLTVHLTTTLPDTTASPDGTASGGEDSTPARAADGGAAGPVGMARIGIGAWAQVDGGIGLSRQVVARLGCDGFLRGLVTDPDGNNPLHLGRRQRHPGQRLRDAVYARDHGHCQYPGCGHTRFLQIHHLTEWTRGGDTDIDRLTLRLRHHHSIMFPTGAEDPASDEDPSSVGRSDAAHARAAARHDPPSMIYPRGAAHPPARPRAPAILPAAPSSTPHPPRRHPGRPGRRPVHRRTAGTSPR
ncbi:HNH endonuclease [Frankia alni]